MKYFTYKEFMNTDKLLSIKKERNITVGVALPTLNEEKTIAKTIKIINDCGDLIDDLIVVDSGSTDNGAKICSDCGVTFIADQQAALDLKTQLYRGKGFNLWASLHYLETDLVVWVDADIKNFSKRFLLGIIGPMLTDDNIKFVKGYYHRPKGDARVTEILVRPYMSLLFPELNPFIQPLSGEYGGRREFLESLSYYSGYSVEIAVLLQASLKLSEYEIAQTFLGKRYHDLQSVASLGRMGASILRTMLILSKQYDRLSFDAGAVSSYLNRFSSENGVEFQPQSLLIEDQPLAPIKNYRNE